MTLEESDAVRLQEGKSKKRQIKILTRGGRFTEGYLSRLYGGHGVPSAQLVLLLALLAQDPDLLQWVSRYWTAPRLQEAVPERSR